MNKGKSMKIRTSIVKASYCSAFIVLLLSGCDSAEKAEQANSGLPSSIEARDAFVADIVAKHIYKAGETLPENPNGYPPYIYGTADLNNNGEDEILILMQNQDYCGSGGCTGFVFDNKKQQVAKFTVMDRPILLGNETHLGWHDIIAYSDGAMHTLRYSEDGYPLNTSTAPIFDYETKQKEAVGLAMNSEYYKDNGTNLVPAYQQKIFDCQSCYLFSYDHQDGSDKISYLEVNVDSKKVTPIEAIK